MSEETADMVSRDEILRMAVDVVAAYLSNNQLPAGQIPEVISTVFRSLNSLDGTSVEVSQEPLKPGGADSPLGDSRIHHLP